MPRPGDKTKKKKKRKTAKGKVKVSYTGEKTGKNVCSICRKAMHGMAHGKTKSGVSKLSRSERKPTALFAGQLCNRCRAAAIDDALRVKEGFKRIEEVDLRFRDFVQQLIKSMEKW